MQTKISLTNKIILGLSIVFMISTTSIYAVTRVLANDGKIVDGVIIKNIIAGNKSKEDIINNLQQLEDSLESKVVVLKYKDKQWPVKLKEMGITIDKNGIFDEAYAVGRQGNWFEQLKDRKRISKYKEVIPLRVKVDEKSLTTLIKERGKVLRVNPKNASFRITSGYKIALIPGKNGVDIDYPPIPNQIKEIVVNDAKPEVILNLRTIKPKVTNEDILNMKVNGVVASFTTTFNTSKVSRSFNVARGTRSLDNAVIKPGQVFSFNKFVGPRNKKNGYKEAPEIHNNTLVNGVGGGICQVSTTLFNTVLLANLPVIERSNHSIPVHYVPLGRDATVTYGGRDFKFKNNTDSYLIIKTRVGRGSITFLLLGNVANKKRVSINQQTLYQISPPKKVITKVDNTLYKGQQVVEQTASPGFRIKATQTVWSGGKVVKKAVFYSTYNPKNRIVRIGSKKRPIKRPSKKADKDTSANNTEENSQQKENQGDSATNPSA